jgi:hypothetical protein
MPPIQSTPQNNKLCRKTRQVVYNVVKVRENECNEWAFTILVQQMYKRAAAAMGISVHSVEKIKQEVNNSDAREGSSSYQTPDNTCQCCVKLVHNITDSNTKVIRKTTYNFYSVGKLVPNVLGLQMKLAGSINFH